MAQGRVVILAKRAKFVSAFSFVMGTKEHVLTVFTLLLTLELSSVLTVASLTE